MSDRTLCNLIASGGFGVLIAIVGFRITDWQFWVLMVGFVVLSGIRPGNTK